RRTEQQRRRYRAVRQLARRPVRRPAISAGLAHLHSDGIAGHLRRGRGALDTRQDRRGDRDCGRLAAGAPARQEAGGVARIPRFPADRRIIVLLVLLVLLVVLVVLVVVLVFLGIELVELGQFFRRRRLVRRRRRFGKLVRSTMDSFQILL